MEDFVYGNERFECLDLVGEDWLPGGVVSRVPVISTRPGGH